jgi:glycerol-3-phosphate acyltransferase PlsY
MALGLALLLAYLLGSIPFGLVVAHFKRVDLRSVGSGNIGATNTARALGKGWGLFVLFLDAGKAALPIVVGRAYFGDKPEYVAQLPWILAGLAAAAFVGHLAPVFARFRGGKGVASALGGFLMLEPKAALIAGLVYVAAYALTRISSVGSLSAVLSFPLWLYLTEAQAPSFALAGFLLLLIVLRHRDNLRRLLARKERRV